MSTQTPGRTGTRFTPLAARGEPMVWLTGLCLGMSLVVIVGLLGMVVRQGLATFWPGPIERLELRDGTIVAGPVIADEEFELNDDEQRELEALRASGTVFVEGAFTDEGSPVRRLLQTGNRDLGQQSFRWVPLWEVEHVSRPENLVLVERTEWGVWIGAVGDDQDLESMRDRAAAARQVMDDAEQMSRDRLGSLNREIERTRLLERSAELRLEQSRDLPAGASLMLWGLAAVSAVGSLGAIVFGGRWLRSSKLGRVGLVCVGVFALLFAVLESPWSSSAYDETDLASLKAAQEETRTALTEEALRVEAAIRELRAEGLRDRMSLLDPSGLIEAPDRTSSEGELMPAANVVRIVAANQMGVIERASVFVDRWVEYLTERPRASNTEGGVMPVLFGTISLTLLLSVSVVPLGVIAAIYLREYAHQGVVTSAIRIAVNNLAGVPSIVYGVFGLGFFCYTLGGFVDGGPEHPMPRFGESGVWWGGVAVAVILAGSAAALGLLLGGAAGSSSRNMALKRFGVLLWVLAAGLAFYLVMRTPYFGGFFAEKLPSPTFGGRGLLWASLTLALLTLPVVIVATEEAIAAVPGSMREGSYGCGANKWQTIRRIVLPAAAPGVMTGAILAMARGAGEVAPLMIVGAVKSAPELPISGEFPFVHLERSFMHLGFHIYDLGFQSPDSQAARPMVWTTTLLLIALVVSLNLVAIIVRARLRAKLRVSAV